MRPEVLLATCSELPNSNEDDAPLPAALAELGIRASWVAWDDPAVDFGRADLVVLRSTWDYTKRRAEFLRWCESVPALANPAGVVRWNTDKSYLVELADLGVGVVRTQLVRPGGDVEWPAGEFVVKPSVGAGSRDAARFDPTTLSDAEAHLKWLHSRDRTAVVQPYQRAVDREGETALVFLGGVYSHGFVKGPMLRSSMDESGLFVSEGLGPSYPAAELRRAAENVLEAACKLLDLSRSELLYARVDLVRGEGGEPLLLELELSEPSLGFRQTGPDARLRFASAVRAHLNR